MIWNLFKKDKNSEQDENSLEKRIVMALKKARQDKRDAERDINKIKGWAAEAIIDVYADFFPNANLTFYREKYKENALEQYGETKKKYASKLATGTVEKCDRIVQGYINQVELRISKMKLYEKLENEYLKTKQQLDNAMKQSARGDKLKSHSERLKELDNDTSSVSDSMTDSYKLEEITKDIEYKEEYLNQLDKLNEEFGDDSNFDNAVSYKSELDKMIKDIEK